MDRTRESDGAEYHVFASAIPSRVARKYWQIINNAMGELHSSALEAKTAPKFAAEAVRSAARALGPMAEAEVEKNFIGEIRRLAMVVLPKDNGWDEMMLDEAISKELLEDDEIDEILNLLVFFTAALSFYALSERAVVVSGAVALWNGRTTSSSFTEWRGSLPTSTPAASSGETTTGASPTPPAGAAPGGVRILSGQSVPS
jgi:hypothetical protein